MTPSSSAPAGLLGDRYELLGPIGTGSAATVFKARDQRSGVLRAAKVLKPDNAANPKILARFEDEFRILRTLHHPHLPEVYDYGWTDDDGRFLIMELVDGVSLDEYFKQNPNDIWTILYELGETLTFVHNHNLLHQDVKPSNILVKRTTAYGPDLPLVKLIDFGLTFRRDAGAKVEMVGTPEYMAPEVARGDKSLSRAVDYYSLGATLFHLLTGKPPFEGQAMDVLRAHLDREPVIDEEKLEWTELYPHVRALLNKERRARLEAFEELRQAVVGRLTGGIDELDRGYGLARIESLPMIGKDEVWKETTDWLGRVLAADPTLPVLRLEGDPDSGVGFLIDALAAEAAIVQTSVVRLGAKRDSRSFVRDMRLRHVRGTNTLVCVDCDTADEREIAFAQYIEALSDTGSTASVGLILYGELQSRDAIVTTDRARDVYIKPLTSQHYEQVVDPFRGNTSAEDVKLIGQTIAQATTSGGVVDLLRGALEANALTFRGGRWSVRRDIPRTVSQRSRKDESNAEAMLSSLPQSQLRLITCIACAEYPVPVSWLPSILVVKESAVESDLQSLAVRRLVNMSGQDASRSALPSNSVFRDAARAVGKKESAHFHTALAKRLEAGGLKDQPALRFLSLAAHYEQLGKYRELAQSHLRAIHVLAATGDPDDTDREYERGIAWFARPEAHSYYPGARAIHRFYVKRYLNSLWSRNLYARAHRLLKDEYVSKGARVPKSFWPKYVRSTLDIEGPPIARKLLKKLDVSKLPTTHELRLLMGLEDALVSFQEGNYDQSRATIQSLTKHKSILYPRHRHRLAIYDAMCVQALGKPERAAALLQRELPQATADGSVDEAVLIQCLCASIAIYGGDAEGGLSQVARALKTACRRRLYFRMNILYRLAASIYVDAGKYQRAARAQTRAIQSAYAIGMVDYVAIGWQRLAEYERAMGMFGNAVRYLERATALLPESAYASHWIQMSRLRFELAVNTKMMERHELARRQSASMHQIAEVGQRGSLEFVLGQYAALEGQLTDACSHFISARELGVRAGMIENAVMAAGAQVRALYQLGWMDQATDPVAFVNKHVKPSSSATLKAEREIVAMRASYLSRNKRPQVTAFADEATNLWNDLESATTRSEVALMLFRLFARAGQVESARHWAGLYMAEVRRMFGNLTLSGQEEGVAHLVSMNDAKAEIEVLLNRSGH